jgi:pseudaminic acid cytidylyltransferase
VRLAVIPARGGSKRIPRKNIRPFAGKPMIAHPVGCALGSGLFDRVVVSTDDDDIAEVAREYGAEVPFKRPAALSDDHAGTTEVIAHAVQWAVDAGLEPTSVCCIYATAPFVRAEDLAQGRALLESGAWQYVFSATRFSFPIFRSIRTRADGGIEMFFPEHFKTRSQDLPEALHDAGQFYWGKASAWLEHRRIFDASSTIVALPPWRVQDIDTEEDWERAELISELLHRPDPSSNTPEARSTKP